MLPSAERRGIPLGFLVSFFALLAAGCGGGGSDVGPSGPSARFEVSPTGGGANRVRLVGSGATGDLIEVDVVIGGPTTSTDLYAFAFDIEIGDVDVLEFVSGSESAGDALTNCANLVLAGPSSRDDSRIVVGVSKTGACTGNAVASGEPAIVSLTFRVLRTGVSSVAISGASGPTAYDSSQVPIGSVSFDTAEATIQAI